MILDVEPEEDEEDEDEEEQSEEDASDGQERRSHSGRRRGRRASDLSLIESSAEMLYGLIHQRFICSRAGIQQMSEKYELGHFGVCPRTMCNQTRTLPVGLSDIPGEDTVKLFCPSCLDVYVPPNSRFQTVDGAFFGRTFGALFLMTFPEYDLSRSGVEHAANLPRPQNGGEEPMLNGMYVRNIAPGLGRRKIYEHKIYGFKVSERSRAGPRMRWLRDKPDDMSVLDETRRFHEQQRLAAGGAESDSDDDASMGTNGRPRRRPPGNLRLRQRQRQQAQAQAQARNGTGSPMVLETNGGESEL